METKLLIPNQPARYRLRLQGHITAAWMDWLTDASVVFDEGSTTVTGTVRDQSALFGLISFVRDLGVPLVSIEFIPYLKRKEYPMSKNILSVALKGIAVATGIAVIVMNILGTLTAGTAASLLGIGLTALAVESLK